MKLVGLIVNLEGGYADDPYDSGGKTKYGISVNNNAKALKRLGVTDIRNLTVDQAKEIYYSDYWQACRAHLIQDDMLAFIHFDAAVNHGVGQSILFMNRMKKNPEYFEGNGKNQALFMAMFIEYTGIRLRFYTRCKTRKIHLEGWVKRMADVCDETEDMYFD